MPKESTFWGELRKKCKGRWLATRIETGDVAVGVADVAYCIYQTRTRGWIELKYLKSYPKRESTAIRIPHYTSEQKLFLWKEGEAAGFVWLFVKIKNDYYLFDHKQAQKVGGLNKKEMAAHCTNYWIGHLYVADFIELISGC